MIFQSLLLLRIKLSLHIILLSSAPHFINTRTLLLFTYFPRVLPQNWIINHLLFLRIQDFLILRAGGDLGRSLLANKAGTVFDFLSGVHRHFEVPFRVLWNIFGNLIRICFLFFVRLWHKIKLILLYNFFFLYMFFLDFVSLVECRWMKLKWGFILNGLLLVETFEWYIFSLGLKLIDVDLVTF